MSKIKDETKRITVTLEIELDEDGVEDLRESYDGDMKLYFAAELSMDMDVKNILEIEEFGE